MCLRFNAEKFTNKKNIPIDSQFFTSRENKGGNKSNRKQNAPLPYSIFNIFIHLKLASHQRSRSFATRFFRLRPIPPTSPFPNPPLFPKFNSNICIRDGTSSTIPQHCISSMTYKKASGGNRRIEESLLHSRSLPSTDLVIFRTLKISIAFIHPERERERESEREREREKKRPKRRSTSHFALETVFLPLSRNFFAQLLLEN